MLIIEDREAALGQLDMFQSGVCLEFLAILIWKHDYVLTIVFVGVWPILIDKATDLAMIQGIPELRSLPAKNEGQFSSNQSQFDCEAIFFGRPGHTWNSQVWNVTMGDLHMVFQMEPLATSSNFNHATLATKCLDRHEPADKS